MSPAEADFQCAFQAGVVLLCLVLFGLHGAFAAAAVFLVFSLVAS